MKSFLGFLFCLWLGFAASAQTAQPGTWLPNGTVQHVTQGDGKTFLSGNFNWFGEYYGGNAAVLNTDLSHDSSYPPIQLNVETAIPDGAGGWYTTTYNTIGHIKADKTVETLPFTFNTSGAFVYGLALSGNILYVGGQFTSINGTARQYLAAIDVTTNTLTSWNPGTNGTVYTLKVLGTTVYVGGSFTTVGGLPRQRIAAIDASTGATTTWNANVVVSGFGYVLKIIPTAGTIYFGGSFTNAGGGSPTRTNFAAVNSTTGALTTFNPRPDNVVRELLLDGTNLYIAGEFTTIAATPTTGLSLFNTATGGVTASLASFPFTYGGPVTTLAVDGSNLYIGGDFLQINGVDLARLAVVNKTTGVLQSTVPRNISHQVRAISIVGTKVLVGSYYMLGINGAYSSLGCAALNETTGQGTSWTPQIPPAPSGWYINETHLHYQASRVYYWQELQYPIDGSTESVLGAVTSTDGAAIPTWNVSVNNDVTAWAFSADALYLAGEFTAINGVARDGFAAVDLVTGNLLSMDITTSHGIGQYVNSMVVANNVLYVGGAFTFDEGGERNNLAAWHAITGVIQPWAPQVTLGMYDHVDVGDAHNGKIYLIGDVFLRVDATTGAADNWTPLYYDIDGGTDNVNEVVVQGNYVYVAGSFSPGLSRVGISSGELSAWQPAINDVLASEGHVASIVVSSTKLYVGGNFSFPRADGQQSHYAQFDLPAEAPNDPPEIAASTSALPVDGVVSIDLTALISDPDDNLDLTTLTLLSETTTQGAAASLDEFYTLTLDYGGPFSGTDSISIEVCDLLEACSQQEIAIEVGGTGLLIYNAVSPNGDGKNDEFTLLNIPGNNKVTILNRWGATVFDVDNYDNQTRVFRGLSNSGSELPSGTYYYRIDFGDGQAARTGYISLRR